MDELKKIYHTPKSQRTANEVINAQDKEGYSALHWSIINNKIEASEYIIQIGANVNTATNEKDKLEGDTPLISASFKGLIPIVKKLVKNGAKIYAKRKNGFHATQAAAHEGHLEVVKFLIQDEPQVVYLRGSHGRTPLIVAASKGHLNIVNYLISQRYVNIDGQDIDGDSPLMAASFNNHTEVVKFLVHKGANIELKKKGGAHAAYLAAQEGNLEILKILDHNAPFVIDLKDLIGRTPLQRAARNGHLNVVKYLISHPQVDIDSQDDNGFSPLIEASINNHTKVVKYLVQKGANIKLKVKSGAHAAYIAAQKGHLNILTILVQNTPVVIDLKGDNGRTPLGRAARKGHLNVVKYILSHPQVDIESQDDNGFSPLMEASFYNHIEVVKYLVQKGAKIQVKNKKNSAHAAYLAAQAGNLEILKILVQNKPAVVDLRGYNGRTPLGAAALKGHLNVVKFLISQPNVNINGRNIGWTPLIFATYGNHEKIVQSLLQKGADTSIKDYFGKTALDEAKSKNYVNIVKILQQ